jgi:hypothetical protein
MRIALAVILLAGCSTTGDNGDGGDDPLPLVADANGCHGSAQLDGLASIQGAPGGYATFGPFAFGHGRFCLQLDVRENARAHFMAESDRFQGNEPPLTFQLQRPDGTVINEGGSLSYGFEDPHSFALVDMALVPGTVEDVVLVVDGDATSIVDVSLFDPLE